MTAEGIRLEGTESRFKVLPRAEKEATAMAAAVKTIYRPADPHPQPIALTQHQMVNIGIGNDPNTPLKYVAEVWYPHMNLICPRKVKLYATSESDAEAQIQATHPKAIIDDLRIL